MLWPRPQSRHQEPPQDRDLNRPVPFVLERRFENVRRGGTFTPTAAVWLTPALGESGLLRDLAPEDLRALLAVLSCLNGNGGFVATPERLAPVLGISPRAARAHLMRLQALRWKGEPLLTSHAGGGHTGESGWHFFQPSPHLFEERQNVISPTPEAGHMVEVPEIASPSPMPVVPDDVRDRVIAHSRATYTRPRAEVEAEINRFLSPDWQNPNPGSAANSVEVEPEPPATPEAREWLRLKRGLVALGVPLQRVQALLEAHPAEKIAQQLEWLSYRNARNPAAYVIAAIEKDYAPPPAVSLRGPTEERKEAETEATAPEVAATPDDKTAGNLQKQGAKTRLDPVEIEVLGMEALTDRKKGDGSP